MKIHCVLMSEIPSWKLIGGWTNSKIIILKPILSGVRCEVTKIASPKPTSSPDSNRHNFSRHSQGIPTLNLESSPKTLVVTPEPKIIWNVKLAPETYDKKYITKSKKSTGRYDDNLWHLLCFYGIYQIWSLLGYKFRHNILLTAFDI